MENDVRRKSIAVPGSNKRRKSSVSYEKFRFGNTTKSNNKPETKLEAIDNASNPRRKSSTFFFTNSMIEPVNGENGPQVHSRERYRKVLREIYAEQEEQSIKLKNKCEEKMKSRLKEQQERTNKFVRFIQYMSTEHETLLQFIVFLPLILTALYIAIIEENPLIKYRT